ncbi:type VII secretion target [Saccharomonospora saliphila]|uniref:type VII secretion target n=1 Tax=Saccharomonospora saliphila TaxID=369829 RepID=UPI00036E41E4|nr:type VII secretion target [Saccharomonospora saliphila]
MTSGGAGYEVLTGELHAHSGKVDGFAERMRTAVDAARQVTMDNSAYGVICQPFALLLQPFEEMGVTALEQAAETISETAGKVREAADAYTGQEGETASAVTQAGSGL